MKRIKNLICASAIVFTILCTSFLSACDEAAIKKTPNTHTHNWSVEYHEDGDRHYRTCDGCDEKKYGEHEYNALGVCVCGKTKSGGGQSETHAHNWSVEYHENGDRHYQTCDGCDEKEYGEHEYNELGVCVCGKTEPGGETVVVESVTLEESSLTLEVADSKTLVVSAVPDSAAAGAVWKSLDASVATVQNGTVTAVSEGKTVVTVEVGDKSAFCTVTVIDSAKGFAFSEFGNGYAVTGYTGSETIVTVPSRYRGKTVSAIGTGNYNGFYACGGIQKVTIPDTIKIISAYSFKNCTALAEIEIPQNVDEIGIFAFENCDALKKVVIPSTFKVDSGFAFSFADCDNIEDISAPIDAIDYTNKKKLKKVEITAGTSIVDDAFLDCDDLTSVTISSAVTSIGENAFKGCSGLTNLTIPNSVASVAFSAFEGCDSLQYNEYDNAYYLGNEKDPYTVLMAAKSVDITSCTIHEKTKVIFTRAFSGCVGLTSMVIPDGVASISSSAFAYCSNLTDINIPEGITTIGTNVFFTCGKLTSVKLPSTVTRIEGQAFSDCGSLTKLFIPNGVTYIGNLAFAGCNNLTLYCEAEEQPSEWSSFWSCGCPFEWGCTAESF